MMASETLLIASLVLVNEFLRRKKPKSVPKGQFAFERVKLPLERGKLTVAPGRFNRFGNCSSIEYNPRED